MPGRKASVLICASRCLTAMITSRAFDPGSCLSMIDAAGRPLNLPSTSKYVVPSSMSAMSLMRKSSPPSVARIGMSPYSASVLNLPR